MPITHQQEWAASRRVAKAHLALFPAHTPQLDAFDNLCKRVLIDILSALNPTYRNGEYRTVARVSFGNVKRAEPAESLRLEEAFSFTPESSQNTKSSYVLQVLVDTNTCIVRMPPAGTREAYLSYLHSIKSPEELRRMVAAGDGKELSAAFVNTIRECEGNYCKIPIMRGTESPYGTITDMGNPEAMGCFTINGRSKRCHMERKPMPNFIHVIKVPRPRPIYVAITYSKQETKYRSSATLAMVSGTDLPVPNYRVKVPFPRQTEISVWEAFLLLYVEDLEVMLDLIWPEGLDTAAGDLGVALTPAQRRMCVDKTRMMLLMQQREATVERGISNRIDLLRVMGVISKPFAAVVSAAAQAQAQATAAAATASASPSAEPVPADADSEAEEIIAAFLGVSGETIRMSTNSAANEGGEEAKPKSSRVQCVFAEILPANGLTSTRTNSARKQIAFGEFVAKAMLVALELRKPDDRDDPAHQCFEGPDQVLGLLFRHCLQEFAQKVLRKEFKSQVNVGRVNLSTAKTMMSRVPTGQMFGVFVNGNSSITNKQSSKTPCVQISHRSDDNRRVYQGVHKNRAPREARQIRAQSFGRIDNLDTSDGQNLALTSVLVSGAHWRAGRRITDMHRWITTAMDACGGLQPILPSGCAPPWFNPRRQTMETDICSNVSRCIVGSGLGYGFLQVNYCYMGRLCAPKTVVLDTLRRARTAGLIPFDVSIFPTSRGVSIVCDNADLVEPIVPVAKFQEFVAFASAPATLPPAQFMQLLIRRGIVQYVNRLEMQYCGYRVATRVCDLLDAPGPSPVRAPHLRWTHMNLHGCLVMLGPALGRMPWPPMNMSPRDIFQATMLRHCPEAVSWTHQNSVPYLSLVNRQSPLFTTLSSEAMRLHNGMIVTVGMVMHPCVKDDAFIVSADAVARGLGSTIVSYTYVVYSTQNLKIMNPTRLQSLTNRKTGDYSNLDDSGVILRGSAVVPGVTVLVGKVGQRWESKSSKALTSMLVNQSGQFEDKEVDGRRVEYTDHSQLHDKSLMVEDGWVVDHVQKELTSGGNMKVTIRVSRLSFLEHGSKLTSGAAQKALIAHVYPTEDMPVCLMTGMPCDVLMSPIAVMSRVTCAHTMEAGITRATALTGKFVDASAFSPVDMDWVHNVLRDSPYYVDPTSGSVFMMCMSTGQPLCQLMGGAVEPNQRVVVRTAQLGLQYFHCMTGRTGRATIHARSVMGPINSTTGTPNSGRKFDGAQRKSHLVNDVDMQHGCAANSGNAAARARITTFPVCKKCGTLSKNPPIDNITQLVDNTPPERHAELEPVLYEMLRQHMRCAACGSYAFTNAVMSPILKLVNDKLYGLNIEERFRVDTADDDIRGAIYQTQPEFMLKTRWIDRIRTSREEFGTQPYTRHDATTKE